MRTESNTLPTIYDPINILTNNQVKTRALLTVANPLYFIQFYKKWTRIWPYYQKLFKSSPSYSRKVISKRGERLVKWSNNRTLTKPHLALYRLKSTNSVVNRRLYFNYLWSTMLRFKFEKFFFSLTGRRTYVWFHDLWKLVGVKLRRWKLFEKSCMWRLTNFRFKMSLRFNSARALLRTIGLFFTIPGSAHCFAHVIGMLLRRFRRHWQIVNLVSGYLKLGRRQFINTSIVGYKILITGKFAGKMRAQKMSLTCGTIKFFMLKWKIDYARTDSFTRWGVFGIQVWSQIRMRGGSLNTQAPPKFTSIPPKEDLFRTPSIVPNHTDFKLTDNIEERRVKKKRYFQHEFNNRVNKAKQCS